MIEEDAAGLATAATLVPGVPKTQTIDYVTDADWFAVQTEVGKEYGIELTTTGPTVEFQLVYADGTPFTLEAVVSQAVSDVTGERNAYVHKFNPTSDQTIVVRVEGILRAGQTGDGATVEVFEEEAGSAYSDLFAYPGARVSGRLDYDNDRDWVGVDLLSGESYAIRIDGTGGETNAFVASPSGVSLSPRADADGTLRFKGVSDGRHFVVVFGDDGADWTVTALEGAFQEPGSELQGFQFYLSQDATSLDGLRLATVANLSQYALALLDGAGATFGGSLLDFFAGPAFPPQLLPNAAFAPLDLMEAIPPALGALPVVRNLSHFPGPGDRFDALSDDGTFLPGVLNDRARGSTDADLLRGFAGADTLNGWSGDDTLDGGSGDDLMIGGVGSDLFYVDSSTDRVVEKGKWAGVDTVIASASFRADKAHIENLTLTGDAIIGVGNNLRNVIRGTDGNNILDGGRENDTMIGGLGNDTYLIRAPGDRAVEELNGGDDSVRAFRAYALDAHIERLYLQTVLDADGNGVAGMNGIGNALDNTIFGNPFDNILIGREGSDTLRGFAGADTFVFDRALGDDNIDRIIDFNTNTADEGDLLRFKQAEFAGVAKGMLAVDAFVAGTAALDAADRFIFDRASGQLWFD
ncbi:MAG: calcium-binding protein, partial [Jannaschia sp.]